MCMTYSWWRRFPGKVITLPYPQIKYWGEPLKVLAIFSALLFVECVCGQSSVPGLCWEFTRLQLRCP